MLIYDFATIVIAYIFGLIKSGLEIGQHEKECVNDEQPKNAMVTD